MPSVLRRAVSYHFVPGVALKDFGAKVKDGKEDLISTNEKEPSILKTGGAEGFHRVQPAAACCMGSGSAR